MLFANDRQRRAAFASMMNKRQEAPAPVEYKPPDSYEGIAVSPIKQEEVPLAITTDVPDWVGGPKKVEESVQVEAPRGVDYLEQYGKSIKPRSSGFDINIEGDKSDITKQVDDALVKYAANIKPEKRIVGATKVDDEYAPEGTVRLKVRNRVKPELDELLTAHLSRNPGWVDMKKSEGGYSFAVGDKNIDIADPEDVKYVDEILQTRLRNRLDKEGVLTESDLTNFRIDLLKKKFGL